jgi:hypothetical protein
MKHKPTKYYNIKQDIIEVFLTLQIRYKLWEKPAGICRVTDRDCAADRNTAFFPQLQLQWKNGQQRVERVGVPGRDVALREIDK